MSNTAKIVIAAALILVFGYALFALDIPYRDRVDDFATCIAAGNPAMESQPRQCRDQKTGKLYVEEIATDKSDMIRVDFPTQNAGISSPANLSGQARGNWFFEASFPIEVRSSDGALLGQGYATAQGDWMTTEFVPWLATVSFDPKGATSGVVRFMKDNPSGLPENDASIEVPVRFVGAAASSGGSTQLAACRPTGCSGQICADEDVASTCEYRAEYACYKAATCGRQANGECGWTETPALSACISNARNGGEI